MRLSRNGFNYTSLATQSKSIDPKLNIISIVMSQSVKFSNYNVGDNIPSLEVPVIKHQDLVRYSGASGDFNPIHSDYLFARKVGLDNVIAHGMYIMAMLGRMLSDWALPKQLHSLNVKFKNKTNLGAKVLCSGKIIKKEKGENGIKILKLSLEATSEGSVLISGDAIIHCEQD